jgi:HK97 family phage portal protein
MIFRDITKNSSVGALPPMSDEGAWIAYLQGRGYTTMTPMNALKIATVFRCVDLVAKTIASLPLILYRKTDTGREKADKHNLYKLLHMLPNPTTTAFEFWHMYIFNLMLTRGGFAKIVRDRNGFIRQLWNIPTANVYGPKANTVNGERYIRVVLSEGKSETLREGDFMYSPGLRMNSDIDPENPVTIAAEVLGLSRALDSFARDFFENGTNLGGFIEYPSEVSSSSFETFKKEWHEAYAGVMNQHKWAILEDGFKVHEITKDLDKSQALESRKHAVIEICRMFGVPPHKVFELDKATFDNIEQINIEYVQEAVAPMNVRLEQTMYKDLLTVREQDVFYSKFNVNALLRGDTATRKDYYNTMRQGGMMNADEIRELEEMNPIGEEEGGKVYLVNGNMISLKNAANNLPKSMQGAK